MRCTARFRGIFFHRDREPRAVRGRDEAAIESGLRAAGPEEGVLLGETAALRERVRAYLDQRDAARAEDKRLVGDLTKEAEAAEAGLRVEETMEALRTGKAPAAADVMAAAARLAPAPPAPGDGDNRRGKKR